MVDSSLEAYEAYLHELKTAQTYAKTQFDKVKKLCYDITKAIEQTREQIEAIVNN